MKVRAFARTHGNLVEALTYPIIRGVERKLGPYPRAPKARHKIQNGGDTAPPDPLPPRVENTGAPFGCFLIWREACLAQHSASAHRARRTLESRGSFPGRQTPVAPPGEICVASFGCSQVRCELSLAPTKGLVGTLTYPKIRGVERQLGPYSRAPKARHTIRKPPLPGVSPRFPKTRCDGPLMRCRTLHPAEPPQPHRTTSPFFGL